VKVGLISAILNPLKLGVDVGLFSKRSQGLDDITDIIVIAIMNIMITILSVDFLIRR
jgi:hypothetical protein